MHSKQEQRAALKALLKKHQAQRGLFSHVRRLSHQAALLRRLKTFLSSVPPSSIAAYAAMGAEFDLLPLLSWLSRREWHIALPWLSPNPAERVMVFRQWRPETLLETNFLGLHQPPDQAPEILPETLLVPVLGFDRQGQRLGYGKGYYDQTLAHLRQLGAAKLLVGIAHDFQELPQIATEAHDMPLDLIVTPTRLIRPAVTQS